MSGAGWRLWVLGSGTALPSAQRDNTYLALAAGGGDCWLIDCASAPYQRLLQAGLVPLRLRGVMLTHSHADHLYGLPALLFQLSLAGYREVLPIYGLDDTLRVAQRVVESFELGEHCAPHDWRALDEDRDIKLGSATGPAPNLCVKAVRHVRPALGVRLTLPGGQAVAYSGDTEPCAAVVELARGAVWLLHECTTARPLSGHSSPEDVGRAAWEAGVGHVGIVHYDPLYVLGREEMLARVRGTGFGGEVRVLEDMEAIDIDGED